MKLTELKDFLAKLIELGGDIKQDSSLPTEIRVAAVDFKIGCLKLSVATLEELGKCHAN